MRLIAVSLVALTSAASADPPGMTPLREPAQPAEELPTDYVGTYRNQIVGADLAALGIGALAAISPDSGARSSTALAELAVATYLISAPMIHLLHDRPGRSALSLGMRILFPVVGGLIGNGLKSSPCGGEDYDSSCDGSDSDLLPILGVAAGILAASIIDAAVLGKADEKPSTTHLTAMPVRGASHGGGMTFGLAGSF